MNMRRIITILHDTALLAIICAATFLAVLVTPKTARVTTSLGDYTFVNTGDSFSLYADGSHKFILFTPEKKASQIAQKLEIEKSLLRHVSMTATDLYDHIIIYIFHHKPWHTTIAGASAIIGGKNIQITTKTNDLVITYGRDDIVVVNPDTLITENSESLLEQLKQKTSKELTPIDPAKRTVFVDTNTISVINPNIPDSVRITLPQSQLITIDKDAHTIHLDEPIHVSATVLTSGKDI